MLISLSADCSGFGILAKKSIQLNGYGIIDSFDSSDPNYSTNGFYTFEKRKAGGDIGVLGTNILAAINATNTTIGQVDIYGKAYTGSGSTIAIASASAIGDTNWIDAGNIGIEPGWSFNDLNISIPDAPAPPAWTGTIQTMPPIKFNTYTNVIYSDGPGTTNIYNGDIKISGVGSVTITNRPGTANGGIVVVNGKLSLSGYTYLAIASNLTLVLNTPSGFSLLGGTYITNYPNSTLIIESTNTSISPIGGGAYIGMGFGAVLKAYFGGAVELLGAPIIIGSQNATNVTFYCLPSSTNFSYSGSETITGTIYAPEAAVSLIGGGRWIGAIVGDSVSSSSFYLDYDEALARSPSVPIWIGAPFKNQAVPLGSNATFCASSGGGLPVSFQWFFNQTNWIADATNSSLTLTNVQLSDAGNYSVAESNFSSAITSAPAILFVYTNSVQLSAQLGPPSSFTNGQFQFNIGGITGLNYAVQTSTNLRDWVFLNTNASPFVFTDTNANFFPQQFYRAVYFP